MKETQTGSGQNSGEVKRLAAEATDVLGGYFREFTSSQLVDRGFHQSCDCETEETEKGIILDPFARTGTTCIVARQHNRNYIGIESNPAYAEIARNRIWETVGETPLDQF